MAPSPTSNGKRRTGSRRKPLLPVMGACCPTCARPLPVEDWTLVLTPLERRIYGLVSRRPEIDAEILYTALYGSDPDGGPDPKTIEMTICNMNKKIRHWGQVIQRARKGHRGQPWRLMTIAEAEG